ncbi:hypothetical protein SEUCBS139899_005995 [Sporothrix eucalyptigena]|uniref:Uncharacterized protein n=1 Tax=Sporothrix eucalyptigena TaxID=1812306 RepID=A0ABP0CWR4_9PEZI
MYVGLFYHYDNHPDNADITQTADGMPQTTAAPMTEPMTGAGTYPDTTTTGTHNKHHFFGCHHNNAPTNATSVNTCTDSACQDKNHNHSNQHGAMAGMGLSAAAGGAAGVAAAKYMHNNQIDHGHHHAFHHRRGGGIANSSGMAGNGTVNRAMCPGLIQEDADMYEIEAHNNFPGTNPHSAHIYHTT